MPQEISETSGIQFYDYKTIQVFIMHVAGMKPFYIHQLQTSLKQLAIGHIDTYSELYELPLKSSHIHTT